MADLTPNQIEDALRQCAYSDSCSGCPYVPVQREPGGDCIRSLVADAAEMMAKLRQA